MIRNPSVRQESTGGRLRRVLLVLIGALVAWVPATTPAAAQYMYLDSNGDGINTSTDRMNKSTPTTIDVWLRTDHNRDGSLAGCDFQAGAMDMYSYEFVLHAVGGTITWGSMSNLIPSFTTNLARDSRDTTGTVYYHNGFGGSAAQVPGTYKLATLTATVATGSPRIDIVTRHAIARSARTSFASDCVANQTYDHTNRFDTNWQDVDGLAAPLDNAPIVTAPGLVLPQDGAAVQFNVGASDPDGDAMLSLTADLTGLPAGNNAVFTAGSPWTSGSFSWTPTANDSGDYSVTFTATNFLPGTHTTEIRVIGAVTGSQGQSAPAVNRLSQNYPNPFNPGTVIDFALAKGGPVRIAIYDPAGRLVRELVTATLPSGPHSVRWDGTDGTGRDVASGVYWCRMEAGAARFSRHMVLLR